MLPIFFDYCQNTVNRQQIEFSYVACSNSGDALLYNKVIQMDVAIVLC